MNLNFQTSPAHYRHWQLTFEGDIATLAMNVDGAGGLFEHYELKLNSYDLGVDIELADALERIVFEHPEVRCVVVTGGIDKVFCAGANINMLSTSTHAWKVNFCKYTNETRLYIEDYSENSGKRFLAALNGTASGGGYELALACDKIILVDDRNSAVSFPELPLLGVLPGTGGLTRIVDKRKIRRDLCDAFSAVAEGIKGKRAVEWDLVDATAPLSRWEESVSTMAREMADEVPDRSACKGIELTPIEVTETDAGLAWKYVTVTFEETPSGPGRMAQLTLDLPAEVGPTDAAAIHAEGADWWIFRMFRELNLALLDLRIKHPETGLVMTRVVGDPAVAMGIDAVLANPGADWFIHEVRHYLKRMLKRYENSAKSLYAVMDEGTAFVGTFYELALAGDRQYLLNDPEVPVTVGITEANAGWFPMANGLTRLQTRFLGAPERADEALAKAGLLDAETANELGLATFAPDDIDWEDELRLAIEERVSFSPDGLTGMEANLRFAGPETMETKIFGRLSAWQNWIFQRPNAAGERGALKCYGTPQAPEFDFMRT
ncbi:MAG: 2,3-epoxybenzoyl-CoA dihydrolase [Planctomycetota bacterium]|nr:2,3-epoxybenzoyl-CoA dihydrolase [Planctomycetota bacterium]